MVIRNPCWPSGVLASMFWIGNEPLHGPLLGCKHLQAITMPVITDDVRLEHVEHILCSGTGVLDFAVDGEQSYYTWRGHENADWTIEGSGSIENDDEDRLVIYPAGEYFVCDISADREEGNSGPVRCRSE